MSASFNAVRGYAASTALGARAPEAPAKEKLPTFDMIHALAETVAKAERASTAALTSGADPHSVIEALAAAELAVETATTVRDKVVEAYQEILRMPV